VLLNTWMAGPDWTPGWRYWFVETLVWLLVGVTALIAIPAVHALDRRWPFGFPIGLVALGLVTRYGLVGETSGPMHAFTPAFVIWLFALGWAAQRATSRAQRWTVTVATLLTVPGFSANPERVVLVMIGVLVLIWWPTVKVPSLLVRPMAVIAAASLWIYLSHWQVYPMAVETSAWGALALCLLAGIVLHAGWESGVVRIRRLAAGVKRAQASSASSPASRQDCGNPISNDSRRDDATTAAAIAADAGSIREVGPVTASTDTGVFSWSSTGAAIDVTPGRRSPIDTA
jgi:hypothetical protein